MLRDRKAKALASVTREGYNLKKYIDFNDDYDVVLAAVSNESLAHGHQLALSFASTRLRNDYNIVLAAVTSAGVALEFASLKLKNNKEIVRTAIKEEPYSFAYASDELRSDINFIIEMIKDYPQLIAGSSKNIKRNIYYVGRLLEINPAVEKYLDEDMRRIFLEEKKKQTPNRPKR